MVATPAPMLLRTARLIDPSTGVDRPGDLLVENRIIAAVGAGLSAPDGATVVDVGGRIVAPALVDSGLFRADVAACVAGGIGHALLMPDQTPVLDDPALVERAERLGKPRLWVRSLAAATQGLAGTRIAELGLLQAAGAVGVATGRTAIADAAVMLRVMRYAAGLGMVVVCHTEEPALSLGSVATDGPAATRLGLPSAPAAAEAIQVARDLRLARAAGAAIHFTAITTAESAALVREAIAAGQDVTAATSPPYFLLNDADVSGYRSYARLSPPLRPEADRIAVRQAIADGTLGIISSRHDPRTQEEKRQPFAEAAPGAAGAATLFALSMALVQDGVLSLPRLLAMLSTAPARRFGLHAGTLTPGTPADLVLLEPDSPWRIDSGSLPGLAGNTPFDGFPVSGKVHMLVKGGEIITS